MVVAVIGAGRGIGKAVAEKFLHEGHQVVIGLLSVTGEARSYWQQYGNNVLVVQTDVTSEETLLAAAAAATETFGVLDAVIQAAGILADGDRKNDIAHADLQELKNMLNVNALGLISGFRSFYPLLRSTKGSVFAAITAGGGTFLMENPLFPAYVVSKVAANKIIQTLKNTVSDVHIIAIHPGRVNTDMGRTTAEIEPDESANGIYDIIINHSSLSSWFLDYSGKELPI